MQSVRTAAEVSSLMLTYVGQSAATHEPLDLSEACRRSMLLLRAVIPSSVVLKTDLRSSGPTISANASQIQQALTNLLQNAIDAIDGRTAADGETLPPGHITVKLTSDDRRVGIIVEDNGKGLPADVEPDRLMEPYVTTRAKGTGLGLAIVRKIMEDHGGELLLENRAEGGARVSLIIPRTQDLPIPVAANQTAPSPQQPKQTAHGA